MRSKESSGSSFLALLRKRRVEAVTVDGKTKRLLGDIASPTSSTEEWKDFARDGDTSGILRGALKRANTFRGEVQGMLERPGEIVLQRDAFIEWSTEAERREARRRGKRRVGIFRLFGGLWRRNRYEVEHDKEDELDSESDMESYCTSESEVWVINTDGFEIGVSVRVPKRTTGTPVVESEL